MMLGVQEHKPLPALFFSRSTGASFAADQLTVSRTGGRFPEFVVKGKTT